MTIRRGPTLGHPAGRSAASKFTPLERILFYDDFDEGVNGWGELIGNHDGNLDNVRRSWGHAAAAALQLQLLRHRHPRLPPRHLRPQAGDAGEAGHMAQPIKRLTFVRRGRVQFETYFTYKAEQIFAGPRATRAWDGNFDPSETDFGDFTISNDICEGDDGPRYHCALRYLNTDEHGELAQKWMYKTSVQTSTKMHRAGVAAPAIDYHVQHPDDWREVPGGHQPLCYNEVPTKVNWHYLRWVFDTRTRRNVELQVNDLVMDLRDIPVPVYEVTYKGLSHLLNFCIDVRTHRNVRNFLYLDSVLVSVDW